VVGEREVCLLIVRLWVSHVPHRQSKLLPVPGLLGQVLIGDGTSLCAREVRMGLLRPGSV
jgi:hypothetical protein